MTTRPAWIAVLCLPACVLAAQGPAAPGDPLPSWTNADPRAAIVTFVTSVVTEGTCDYVAPDDRIAVFDNDGTLWCEQPAYTQLAFAIDRLKALAPGHPEWKGKEPFDSLVSGDMQRAAASGERAVVEALMTAHAGMTTEEFAQIFPR